MSVAITHINKKPFGILPFYFIKRKVSWDWKMRKPLCFIPNCNRSISCYDLTKSHFYGIPKTYTSLWLGLQFWVHLAQEGCFWWPIEHWLQLDFFLFVFLSVIIIFSLLFFFVPFFSFFFFIKLLRYDWHTKSV